MIKRSNLDGDPTNRITRVYVKGYEDKELPKRVKKLGISTMQ